MALEVEIDRGLGRSLMGLQEDRGQLRIRNPEARQEVRHRRGDGTEVLAADGVDPFRPPKARLGSSRKRSL